MLVSILNGPGLYSAWRRMNDVGRTLPRIDSLGQARQQAGSLYLRGAFTTTPEIGHIGERGSSEVRYSSGFTRIS